MYEYLFLYGVAFIAVCFAAVQDLRTREIANWLTFALIAFVLAYRAFYAAVFRDLSFFLYGLGGVLLFVVLGYGFYYSRVFAGGDAKLLFGLGGIFPYVSLSDYVFYGLGFVFVLFACGVLYTLIYSGFLLRRNYASFRRTFAHEFAHGKTWLYASLFLFIFLLLFGGLLRIYSWIAFLFPILYFYTRAIEKSCMINLISPDKLSEGDWLVKDIHIGKKIILKTVHGLSYKDILLLRRAGKKVLIKSGVPFAPVFLIALAVFAVALTTNVL